MSSKWRRSRVVKKEFDQTLNELGLTHFVARRPSHSLPRLPNDGAANTVAAAASTAPPSPAEPGSSGRLMKEPSIGNAGEPASKRSRRDDDGVFQLQADFAERVEQLESQITETSFCECSGSTSSSSDEGSLQWHESSDDCVASDNCTGSVEKVAPTRSTTFPVVPVEVTACEQLAGIAVKHNMTHACINDALNFCRHRGVPDLPRDARTLLKTEHKARVEQDGSFVHLGLEEGIRRVLRPGQVVPDKLKFQGNIDGVPLHRSSLISFWPILCRITNVEASPPFVVSVYCGAGKPPSLEDYLQPFLQELSKLTSEGMTVGTINAQELALNK
ncbi:hypothetical protein HPB50_013595 [Hyalomma asiaticum]|uniref:Uncharacterized protein n=1 Tax=Hyalomma asiaticum TaxID=266040 RepID=A0ACB7RKR6_HYAAI|nr:hypothetical protein HPB50_013595 [Hyalomma asiaticum]